MRSVIVAGVNCCGYLVSGRGRGWSAAAEKGWETYCTNSHHTPHYHGTNTHGTN